MPKRNKRRDVTGAPVPFWSSPYYRRCAARVHGAERCRYCVYAVFADPGNGLGFIKIGITEDLLGRLGSIQTGCPIPIDMVAVIDAGHYSSTPKEIEEMFHKRFADRRSSGEWFTFDFWSDEDRREFNDGSREVLREYFGEKHPWWVKKSWKNLRKEIQRIKRASSIGPKIPRVVGDTA